MNYLPLRRIFGLFACIFVVIAVVAVLSIRQINRAGASADWVNQTHSAIHHFETVISSLFLAEGMMRSYVVTSDLRDKEASADAFANVEEHFAYADALLRDREDARKELEELRRLSAGRRDFAESVWAAVDTRNAGQAKQLLLNDAGVTTKSAIRHRLEKLRDDQFQLLSARDRESFRQAQTTRWIVGIGVGLNLLLFGLVGWLIRADLARRSHVARVLEEANHSLEERVRLRTSELSAANAELEDEILERKWVIQSQEHQLRYNQAVVSAVHDLVIVLSKVLNITRVNPAATAALGGDESEILTQNLGRFVVPADAATPDREMEAWRFAIETGREITRQPIVIKSARGENGAGLMTMIPLRDSDKVVGAIAVIKTHTLPKPN